MICMGSLRKDSIPVGEDCHTVRQGREKISKENKKSGEMTRMELGISARGQLEDHIRFALSG